MSKIVTFGHFFRNGGGQYGALFEYGAIFKKNSNLGMIRVLNMDKVL